MKVLFFHASSFNKMQLCMLMDEAERLYQEGNEVFFAVCNGVMNSCCSNENANGGDCCVCKISMRKTLKLLSSRIEIIHANDYVNKCEFDWQYDSLDSYKNITYKGVEIGYAAMSFYVSKTRNLNPLFNRSTKRYFNNLLTQGAILTDAISNIIDKINPDKVCVFNGRQFDVRPAMQIAMLKGIKYDVYEVILANPNYKVVFHNSTPHDILYNTHLIEESWEKSSKSLEEKRQLGRSYYELRQNGFSPDGYVYVANQKKGVLPQDWDYEKRNIVIFSSSEDEFASIGKQYDQYSLFKTQLEEIETILNLALAYKDIHFYLRVHPNLKAVNYRHHLDLYNLDKKYINITIIRADEKVSSYDLMHAAEKVIVHVSSMGIESAYWGKPVILLSGTLYYFLGACYTPHDINELKDLIINKIPPLSDKMEDILKYGFYNMDHERSVTKESYSFFDYNPFHKKIAGMTIRGTNCQKLLGSKNLYAIYISFKRLIFKSLCLDRFPMPRYEA